MAGSYAEHLARGLVGLAHDWKAAGRDLSKVAYFPGVKRAESPKIAALSEAGRGEALGVAVENLLKHGGFAGEEIADFLDQFLPAMGLTWDDPAYARLRALPKFDDLVDALLKLLVAWHENGRKPPAAPAAELRKRLKLLDSAGRERIVERFFQTATGPDAGWGLVDVEDFLGAAREKLGL